MPARDVTWQAVFLVGCFIVGFMAGQLILDVRSILLVTRDTRAQVLAISERFEEERQRGKTVR